MTAKPGVISDYTRGSDTFWHIFRMFRWSVAKLAMVCAMVAIGIAAFSIWNHTSTTERETAKGWTYAWFMDQVLLAHDARIEFTFGDVGYAYHASYVVTEPWFVARRDSVITAAENGLKQGSVVGFLTLGLAVIWFLYRGRALREDRLVRGGQIIADNQIRKHLRRRKQASDIVLGQVPMIRGTEVQHLLVSGSGGTGKTQLLFSVLDAIRARGEAAVIYDSTGAYVRSFHQKGDIILCPFDARSPSWTPWAEILHPSDALRVATSIVAAPRGNTDPFWSIAAQRLLSAALLSLSQKPERDISQLLRLLSGPSMTELAAAVEGMPIAGIFSETKDAENRLANSVRGTLLPYIEALQFLPSATSAADEFSLRRWVEDTARGTKPRPWLFLLSRADFHETLKPLISCWLDSLAAGLMSLGPDPARRMWFVVDEMPSLQRLPSVLKLLAEARQFGAACVLGIQGVPQLRAIYGRDESDAIVDLCNTHAIFRTNNPDTAQWASRLLGEREINETKESFTYSANDVRDGIHLSDQRQTRPIVLGTEVSQLETLHFFVRLAGNYPVTKTKITPRSRPDIASPYVEADIYRTAWASLRPNPDSSTSIGKTMKPISFNQAVKPPKE